jgi:hypothetical protein
MRMHHVTPLHRFLMSLQKPSKTGLIKLMKQGIYRIIERPARKRPENTADEGATKPNRERIKKLAPKRWD